MDAAGALGVDFVHFNGAQGKKYMPETVGSGCAFLDYDNDGWMDILLVNSAPWPADPRPDAPPTLRLYRNVVGGRFEEVTARAGLAVELYGMGVAPGDYDNDGDTDLYITAVGPNRLFRNDGNGHFTEVTDRAGVGDPAWGMSAVWFDVDRDGDLDLFVANYVDWSIETDQFCGTDHKIYCGPASYPGSPHLLYRNNGDGTFTDVTRAAGVAVSTAKGMGAVAVDVTGDGALDLLVANDRVATNLFVNDGAGRFEDVGLMSGLVYGEMLGQPIAGMGIDVVDFRNDGSFGVLVSNFAGEGLAFFEQQAATRFAQRSRRTGFFTASINTLGFGVVFADFNLDGWSDAFVTNGQTSYDPRFIRDLFPGKDTYQHAALAQLYDVDLTKLDKLAAEKYRLFEEVSAINHLSKDDPPVILSYNRSIDTEVTNQSIGIHHAKFGKVLKERMDALGIRCEVYAAGRKLGEGPIIPMIDFLKQQFGLEN